MEKELTFINNINLIKYNSRLLNFLKISLCSYSNYIKKIYNSNLKYKLINVSKNNRIFLIFNYYIKFNYNKLKKIKNNDYYKNSENLIVILDLRCTKPKIFVINNNKCLFSVTSGLIYKKLNLKQKKIKKTEKMLNLLLKTASSKLQKEKKFKKCIIHLKGTRSNIFNILVLINKNFNNKLISLIYAPHISYGLFKFKKIKSIKKRLRKKFSRLIKN